MRLIVAAFALLLAVPAFADVYNLQITMPAVSGAANCKPYMNGAALVARPCGSVQAYAAAVPTEGTYSFNYSGVSSSGLEGARGPSVTFVIDKAPSTPTTPPTVVIQCRDGAGASVTCPPNITISPAP